MLLLLSNTPSSFYRDCGAFILEMVMSNSNIKHIVYVDGENFIHRAVELLGRNKDRESLIGLDLKKLICNLISQPSECVEVRYYTTKVKFSGVDPKNHTHLQEIANFNSRWLSRLASHNVKVIRAGILRFRESKPCKKCHSKTDNPTEKGVDVRLAVDLVEDSYSPLRIRQYVVSSDLDILPAIEVARKNKNKVVYIASTKSVNRAMVASTSEVLTFTRQNVKESK